MARSASKHPTELELRMLKVLWEESPLTARQIREALAARGRGLAHTSVITTLQKMVAKRQVKQLDPVEGKALRFAPQMTERDVSERMLGDLIDRVFDGSAEAVMLSLFDVSDLDNDSLKRLRRAFNQKMREKNNG
jgi:predicted transcriptional regulator